MLGFLTTGRARRELFRLLWDGGANGGAKASVSALARAAGVSFSGAHRELEAMRAAGLAFAERVGTEVVYRANSAYPHADLARRLAPLPAGPSARTKRQ